VLRVPLAGERVPHGVGRIPHDAVHLSAAASEIERFDDAGDDIGIGIVRGDDRGELHAIETAVEGNF